MLQPYKTNLVATSLFPLFVFLALSFVFELLQFICLSNFLKFMDFVAVFLMVCVTKVAKDALEKALAENEKEESVLSSELPISDDLLGDLQQPLIVRTDLPLDSQ